MDSTETDFHQVLNAVFNPEHFAGISFGFMENHVKKRSTTTKIRKSQEG